MRPSTIFICCISLLALATAGCELPPEKVKGASDRPTYRQGEYMPKLSRWETESVAVNRQWFEVFVHTKGIEGKELVGYYQKRRDFKQLPLQPGERTRRRVPIYVHFVYPVKLKEPVGFFTDNGHTYRYVWSDREKKIPYVASASHENALKLLLDIPVDKTLFIKPASRPEEFMWFNWEFKRK